MPGDPMDVSARQAAEALDDLARLRLHARRSSGGPWFPLLCFGALAMLSAPLVAVAGLSALLPLWAVVGTAVMFVVARHYRRRALRRGVTGRRRVWAVAFAIFAVGLLAGLAGGIQGGEAGGVLAPVMVEAAGYLALGWFRRDLTASLAIVPGAVVAVVMVLAGSAVWAVELVLGASMVAAGAVLRAVGLRAAERRS